MVILNMTSFRVLIGHFNPLLNTSFTKKYMPALNNNERINSLVLDHYLVPKHEILTKEETQKMYEQFNIEFKNLPKIDKDDPAIKAIKGKQGDVVKIIRPNGKVYYRGVV